jgi:rSAM/selenodomain-associated transferase 2
MPSRLSIIIPVVDEAEAIEAMLGALQPLRRAGHQIIVVDGGSGDDTASRAAPLCDLLLTAPRGRATQMNTGAAGAIGDTLIFLHADTKLPERADALVLDGLQQSGALWGRFDVRIAGAPFMLGVIGFLMNYRSRLTGVATGDQAIFVRAQTFRECGGFPEQLLMEDIALSKLLKKRSAPLCLSARVETSGRRWEKHGVWRTVLLMWRLRLAYFLGASPARLASIYGYVSREK